MPAVLAVILVASSVLNADPVAAVEPEFRVPGADAAIEADGSVAAARAAQERAGAELTRLSAALDAAAGAYERANAHALRLEQELVEARAGLAATHDAAARVERNFADRVVGSYKHPAANAELAQAVFAADDPRTALHRVALLQHVNVRGADRLADARRRGARRTDAVQQHRVVLAGSAGAAADANRTAEALSALVEEARAQAAEAQQQVGEAEDAVRERVAEDLRRAAAAEAAAADNMRVARSATDSAAAARIAADLRRAFGGPSAATAAAMLDTAGATYCPIAGHNGFIDSWGFPRSGGRSHQGTDMFAAYGTPLVAVADGTVRRVWSNALGGLSVDFVTDQGDRFYHAHLSAAYVQAGQRLSAGEVLGAVGDSGNARGTPPHLHWQYHPGDGPPVNPYSLAVALCR